MLDDLKDKGDQNQQWASRLMQESYGHWLLIIAALIIAGIGIYQLWYGFSGKYKDHVEGQDSPPPVLLRFGKIGYPARGIVWLIIAWLLLKAALHHNPSEAGDTSKAFSFIEASTSGSLMLGAIGIGLAAYGLFSFIRMRYENF
jgi:hypothetical protein